MAKQEFVQKIVSSISKERSNSNLFMACLGT